jgi:hypothetical protein
MSLTSSIRRLDPESPIYLGNPLGISAYADQQTDAANAYLLRLGDAVAGLQPPAITPEFPTGGSAPAIENPAPPTFTPPVWTSPAIPAAFSEILELGDLDVEPFDENPPVLQYGTAPGAFAEVLPSAPSVNLEFEDPTLSVTLPAPPSLLSISVRPFAGLNLPALTADEPVLDIVEPTIRNYTPGAFYTSALLEALQASLLDRISGKGTGLGQEAETALWDRAREREARGFRTQLDELERMERLGMPMPPGIYLAKRTELLVERDAQERGLNREIMIESARLELDNVKHALTTATTLEGQLIDYSNSVEQRLFEATRYATEAGVAIYNAKVQAFAALVDVYRAKVQAYEALVRAEIAKVDAYRAEVAAEQAKAEVNRTLVDTYRAQIEAALSNIRIYEAQIQGIRTKAEIEQTKVAVFGEQVRAYAAQVNAYTAGIEGYRASLQAEETKQRVFQSGVEAFRARVEAASTQINARVRAYEAVISAKNSEWDGYRATVTAEASRVESIARVQGAVAETYSAQVRGIASYNEVLTRQWQATLDQNQRTAEIAISAAKANAELYVTTRSLAIDAAKVGAQVSAQLGASALNAINWSSSISTSNSVAIGSSVSYSESNSSSESRNENYNYSV